MSRHRCHIHHRMRWPWIENWIREHGSANILDAEFVEAYIAYTGASHEVTMWGANKCPLLSRDLSALHGQGILERGRVALGAGWQPGFPKWVFGYSLPEAS